MLYEIHRSDLAEVSIGDAFDSLLRAGSRHGVHIPPEFFLLTRAFVILESMIRQLDPDHNYLGSFREEISRLTAQHFSMERIKDKTGKLARELERLGMMHPATRAAPSDVSPEAIWAASRPLHWRLWEVVSAVISSGSRRHLCCGALIGGAMLVVAPRAPDGIIMPVN